MNVCATLYSYVQVRGSRKSTLIFSAKLKSTFTVRIIMTSILTLESRPFSYVYSKNILANTVKVTPSKVADILLTL